MDVIYTHEILLLALWFAAPVLLVGLVMQIVLFWRRGAGVVRSIFGVLASVAGTVVMSIVFWLSMPLFDLPFVDLPGPELPDGGPFRFIPRFFLPSYIAVALVLPLVTWQVVRRDHLTRRWS